MKKQCRNCSCEFVAHYRAQAFCSITCSNRYNLNNKSKISFPKKFDRDLAELFGILLGDGSVEKYFVRIYLNRKADRGYPQKVMALIRKLFPKVKVTCIDREKRGTEEVQVSSIDVCNFLRKIGFDPKLRTIPDWISENTEFTKAVIRGLFDTEGTISVKFYHGNSGICIYKQLTVTNKNKNILFFLEQGLRNLGYRPTKNSEKNIYISNREDIERYFLEIGTSNPKMQRKFDEKFQNVSE